MGDIGLMRDCSSSSFFLSEKKRNRHRHCTMSSEHTLGYLFDFFWEVFRWKKIWKTKRGSELVLRRTN